MSARVKFDIENVCRTCLSTTTSLRSLTALLCDDRTIYDILTDVIDEDIALSEQLPYQICHECEITLFKYEKFRQTCLKNEEVLKNWIISIDDKSSVASQDDSESKDGAVQYQCSICRTNYKNIPELEEHFSLVHLVKTDVSYELFCDIKPVTSDIKQENIGSYEISTEEEYCDPIEIEYTPTEPVIEIHTENVVVNELYEANLKVEKNIDDEDIDNVEQYNCTECKVEFQSTRALNIHLRKKHELPKRTRNELHQCPLCMRKFNKKTTLELHIKRHEERARKTFTCTNCKREFKHQAHLDNHIKSIHKDIDDKNDDAKQHSCNICGKRFQMLSTLKEHYRVHTGEKPFLCATCGRGFSQKTNLKEHIRRHLGLKPFPCDICSLRFVSKGEMTAHQRTHTGAHPFICETCNGRFTTSSSLVKHRRIHTGERPFACDLCPMKFTASGTLKNHRRTHTGEKPYHCAHCDKAFVQRNDLVSHTRCHTGERPFVCSVCGQAFRQASALKSHFKMHNFKDSSVLAAFQRKECLNGGRVTRVVCENSSSASP